MRMKSLIIAYYVTPHGLGHATRALEVIRELMRRGHAVVLSSGATVGLFFQSQLNNEEKLLFTFRTAVFDSGQYCVPCTLCTTVSYNIKHLCCSRGSAAACFHS